MTRKQFLKNYKKMVKDAALTYLLENGEKAISCGAIDLDRYKNDFELPRIVLTAAAKSLAYSVKPFTEENRREVKNLEYFI